MAKNFLDSLGSYLPSSVKEQARSLSLVLKGAPTTRLGDILEAARTDQPGGLPAFSAVLGTLWVGFSPESEPAPLSDFDIGDTQKASQATSGLKSILQALISSAATQSYTSSQSFDAWKTGTEYADMTIETAPLVAVAEFVAENVTPGV